MDLEPYRAFLIELAESSGEFIRPHFGRTGAAVETKSDQSPVTEADRGAEELMRRMIKRKFPGHGIIGEEFGNEKADAEFTWVLDPIDGTKAFITACPLFGTLIALMHRGQPVLGAIHQPVLRQLLIGDSRTAELNRRPVRVRKCPDLASAVLLTSDPLNPGKYRDGAAFETLSRQVRFTRTWGDCYGYLLVASGWADIMTDPIVNPWDIQAIIPIIRGAGGQITDWRGNDPVKGDSLVAAHPDLHPRVISALNGPATPR